MARAVCVSRDLEVARVVGAALAAAGFAVEHADAIPAQPGECALLVVDRTTRREAGDALRAAGIPVVVVGDNLDDDGLISLMLEAPVSHLIGDPSDRDLTVTSEKLASGDVFGLEKYLGAGAAVSERAVRGESDKRVAIDLLCAWAESAGARRSVVHRLRSVADELLMNALREAASESPVLLRWGHDDRSLGLSVSDECGRLRQRDVMDHVRRARNERGRPEVDPGGAGLGLYFVLANVAALVVNVAPGRRTEIVCLFDRPRAAARAIASGVRSLHIFQTGSGPITQSRQLSQLADGA
jgi:hypothetical protein